MSRQPPKPSDRQSTEHNQMSSLSQEPKRQVASAVTNKAGEFSEGMLIERDVSIPMNDGLILRADVFRPHQPGAYPVIMSHGPYGKGLAFEDGYPGAWKSMTQQFPEILRGSTGRHQNWETIDPEKWVGHGYACIRVDSRGAGRSPGYLDPWSPQETDDFFGAIEWAAVQPWSNGKVGLSGISYYGMNQWHVAGRRPKSLAAICVWEGAGDLYRDASHHGGIYCTWMDPWYQKQVIALQHGVGSRGTKSRITGELVSGPETLAEQDLRDKRCDLGAEIFGHPLWSDYYAERSARWDVIEVPLLTSANWGGNGLHLRGNIEGFVQTKSKQKWLEVHGGDHWSAFYIDSALALQKRFFGHFLKGEDNGWQRSPAVKLQVRHVDRFVERDEEEWPLRRTNWTRLHLDAQHLSLSANPPPSEQHLSYSGMGDGVTFLLPPSEREIEITGPLAARLFVSSQTSDADLFVVVRLFTPDMKEIAFQGANDPNTPIAQGWLRASHRQLDPEKSKPWRPWHTHTEKQPLVPNDIYALDIEIWPTSVVIPVGYRLALTIRGKDYEFAGPAVEAEHPKIRMTGCGPFLHNDERDRPASVFGGKVTLHCGGTDRASYLLVPVIPPDRASL
jgi:putative CocE/NonD family hydrolase